MWYIDPSVLGEFAAEPQLNAAAVNLSPIVCSQVILGSTSSSVVKISVAEQDFSMLFEIAI